jgi:hypothetical protein
LTPANNHELDASPPVGDLRSRRLDQSQVPPQTFSQPYQLNSQSLGSDVGRGDGAAQVVTVQREADPSRTRSETVLSETCTSGSSSRMDELRAKRTGLG